MKKWFDAITNIATFVTCVVIIGVLAQGRFQSSSSPPSLSKGDRVDMLNNAPFNNGQRTLLMALRKDCPFCEDSMPFYRQLREASTRQQAGVPQFVVVTTDDTETAASYLRERSLSVDKVVSISPSALRALKVPGTPTLILADAAGLIEAVWIGRLSAREQADVMKTLGLAS